MVFYGIFFPRSNINIRISAKTHFMFYSIFRLDTFEYVRDISLDKHSIKPAYFFWKEGNGYYSHDKYLEHVIAIRNDPNTYLSGKDLRNFLDFIPNKDSLVTIEEYLIQEFQQLLLERLEETTNIENFFS